jgi:hypothetical protein
VRQDKDKSPFGTENGVVGWKELQKDASKDKSSVESGEISGAEFVDFEKV